MVTIDIYKGSSINLLEIARAWQAEADTGFGLKLEPEHFIAHLQLMIDGPDSDVLVRQLPNGFMQGFMGVHLLESPLSGELMAEEHMWYILPRYRSLEATRAFLAAAEAWGKERGATQFILTASRLANIDAGRVMRMYGRLGFKPFEQVFIRPIGG